MSFPTCIFNFYNILLLNVLGEEETTYWEKSKKDRQAMRQRKGSVLTSKCFFRIIIICTIFSVQRNLKYTTKVCLSLETITKVGNFTFD